MYWVVAADIGKLDLKRINDRNEECAIRADVKTVDRGDGGQKVIDGVYLARFAGDVEEAGRSAFRGFPGD